MKRFIVTIVAAVCMSGAFLPGSAGAQAPQPWQFGLQLYGWFPTISGKTTFPHESPPTSVTVDADEILSNLKFVFMGSFEARKGRWGAFTDVVYMDIGDSRSETRELSVGGVPLPAGATASASYDLKGLVWTLAGSYRAVSEPAATMDVFAGARLADVEQELGYEVSGDVGSIPLPGRGGSRSVNDSYWDGIVGVKGRVQFGHERRWFVPYYVDIGTGDSDLTWQAMGGIGYSFHWGDVVGAWRYLDYDFKSGSAIQDLTFSGPAVSVVFRW